MEKIECEGCKKKFDYNDMWPTAAEETVIYRCLDCFSIANERLLNETA